MFLNLVLFILNIFSILFLLIQIIKKIKNGEISYKLMLYILVLYLNIFVFKALINNIGGV